MNNARLQRHDERGITPPAGSAGPASNIVVEGEALFRASLPVIDDITGQVCRRYRLSPAEADDFRSEVRLHFIDRDYEVLRRFQKRSSLPTYVTVVIQRLFLDHRNRMWGKWRPSTDAKRLGPDAILLERLVTRDGWSLDQVVEALRVNHGVTINEALQGLCDKLVRRGPKRQLVSEEHAASLESPEPSPDVNVVRAEHGFLAKRVRVSLQRALRALGADERLILRMRFDDAVPVADIARALHLNQKRLYRRIERLLQHLGQALHAEGISRDEARAALAHGLFSEPGERDSSDAPPSSGLRRLRSVWPQQR